MVLSINTEQLKTKPILSVSDYIIGLLNQHRALLANSSGLKNKERSKDHEY